MLLNFKSIKSRNFLSLGNVEVDLSNQGLVYVVGENQSPDLTKSNGAGKSSIFESIFYALTGSTLRGTTDVLNQFSTEKFVDVTLTLEVDGITYEIRRTRNHPECKNPLMIIRDGEDISGDGVRKSTEVLRNELGSVDAALLSSVVILGQGLPNRFTSLSPSRRKERLEVLSQSTDFIGELDVRLSNFTKYYQAKLTDCKVDIARHEGEIGTLQQVIKSCSIELNNLTLRESTDVGAIQSKIAELEHTTQLLRDKSSQFDSHMNILTVKINQLRTRVARSSGNLSSAQREVDRVSQELSQLSASKCPTCHQWINDPERVESLRQNALDRLARANDTVKLSSSELTQYNNHLQMLETEYNNCNARKVTCANTIHDHSTEVAKLKQQIQSVQDQIEKINKDLVGHNARITVLKQEIDSIAKSIAEHDLKLKILSFIKQQASKEFRGYLLKGVLQYLNSKVDYYSDALFGTKNLSLELSGNNINIWYDSREYENLSGGERQRVDLAIQFSLRDMLIHTLGFNCNLLVIDEGFDNLDESGVKSLIQVINGFSGIDSVFTISHHHLSLPFDKVLKVVKSIDKVSTVQEIVT